MLQSVDSYQVRFAAAVAEGRFADVGRYLTPHEFPEKCFGELGEGHVLAQPNVDFGIATPTEEIERWLASDKVAGAGLEAATLADGFKFAAGCPDDFLLGHRFVVWGSVSVRGLMAQFGVFSSPKRRYAVAQWRRGERCYLEYMFFLLRKKKLGTT